MSKNVKKSDDLFDLSEVAAYFGISESTVRRKVRRSRKNGCGFPIPLLSARSRLLWRKSDILDFKGEDAETIDFILRWFRRCPKHRRYQPVPNSVQDWSDTMV